jgi:methyl-accepting chemotaxis protein
MGFLDALKKIILGTKEKADDVKDAAARAGRKVDDTADKTKRAADKNNDVKDAAARAERKVDASADKTKRAADKADNAVDDTAAASDELKKE